MGWQIIRSEDGLTAHIVPVDDIEPHDESMYCLCKPKEWVNDHGLVLYTHNSFDGREVAERLMEEMNLTKQK
jgi:hypothetical protein